MKNKFLLLSLVCGLAFSGFALTRATAAEKSDSPRGKILERISQQLELTADQRSQIKSILGDQQAELKPLVAALAEARKGLREAIHAKDATEGAVRAAASKVGSAEADLAVERMKIFAKISPVLTDEQRAKMAEMESRLAAMGEKTRSRASGGDIQ